MRIFVQILTLFTVLVFTVHAEGPVPEPEEEIETVQTQNDEPEPLLEETVKEPESPKKQTTVDPIPEGELSYTGGRYKNHKFRYRLHVPEIEPGKTYPLILWLHGYGGEIGDNNTTHVGHKQYLFSRGSEKTNYPFFVLFPQCPKDNPGWYASGKKEDQMATVALAMLDDIVAKYPVDENRIILFGISGGGTACWRMLAENPDRFAAVVPTASGGCEGSRLQAIPTDVPIWTFHYNGDRGAPIKRVQETVTALQNRGVPAAIYSFRGNEHGSWKPAFLEADVLDWMLLQQRGKYLWYPPGMPHWPEKKCSVVYSWFSCAWLPTLLVFGVFFVRYDRKRKMDRFQTESEEDELINEEES